MGDVNDSTNENSETTTAMTTTTTTTASIDVEVVVVTDGNHKNINSSSNSNSCCCDSIVVDAFVHQQQQQPPPPPPPSSHMIYMSYDGNFITECTSQIVHMNVATATATATTTTDSSRRPSTLTAETSCTTTNTTDVCIVLDRTVMHAQGGGQPTDIGQMMIVSSSSNISSSGSSNEDNIDKERDESTTITTAINDVLLVVNIHKVVLDRTTGIVQHYGTVHTDCYNGDGDGDDTSSATTPNHNPDANRRIVPTTTDGASSSISFCIGATVRVQVNVEQRRLLSECHTAGHVVDAAMVQNGFHFKPSKGYHYLDSPYVEYCIDTTTTSTTMIFNETHDVPRLQATFQQLLQQDIPTQIELLSKQEAHERCNNQQPNNAIGGDDDASYKIEFFDMDQYCSPIDNGMVRIVTVAGYACPCGGTHVRSTGELLQRPSVSSLCRRQWNITGIKRKKGLLRIKYGMTSTKTMK